MKMMNVPKAQLEKKSDIITIEMHQCCNSQLSRRDCKIAYRGLNSSTGIVGCCGGGGTIWVIFSQNSLSKISVKNFDQKFRFRFFGLFASDSMISNGFLNVWKTRNGAKNENEEEGANFSPGEGTVNKEDSIKLTLGPITCRGIIPKHRDGFRSQATYSISFYWTIFPIYY